jgi:hypothetical protein
MRWRPLAFWDTCHALTTKGAPRGRKQEGPTVWLGADTLTWPEGGGNFWPYANWALGLLSNGCRVVWLERAGDDLGDEELWKLKGAIETKLARYGLEGCLALYRDGQSLEGTVGLDQATDADLLLNVAYDAHADVLHRFDRKAMIDIDPGLTQVWATEGTCPIPEHDTYFTIGETVGDARFPDCGLTWEYTPPCVALDWWPVTPVPAHAPFTTVTNWHNPEWFVEDGTVHNNNKRSGFQPYIELPVRVAEPLELALCLEADEHLRLAPSEQDEARALERLGWRVRHSYEVSSTPWDYQRYIQASRGEFSAAKASYRLLANAWLSDRTICYLASGRPAVVEYTGPSAFLPDRAGLLRFRDADEAAECLREAAADWARQSRLARALAEEHFDARVVTARVLARALGRSPFEAAV